MAFDLNTLAAKDTTTLHLLHPKTDAKLYADEDKKEPLLIELYGPSSKQHRNAVQSLLDKRAARGKVKVSSEVQAEEWIDVLVACTISIQNIELVAGVPLNTPEQFKSVYSNPAFEWLTDQITAARGDVGNFLTV